jgi:hypothetical protein
LLEIAARARLLAVFASLAWLLGVAPPAPVRLAVVGLVAAGLALDHIAGTLPAAVRITTLKGRNR